MIGTQGSQKARKVFYLETLLELVIGAWSLDIRSAFRLSFAPWRLCVR
jgi:hypothetical protein